MVRLSKLETYQINLPLMHMLTNNLTSKLPLRKYVEMREQAIFI